MNAPLISVVIPCYNQGEFLVEAIDSIECSTYSNVEIIVVDDGSDDGVTLQRIQELECSPNVTVVRQSNQGLPSARNRGVVEAKGEYILPLDADDRIERTFLMKAAWILWTKPDIGIVYCLVRLFGDVSEIWVTEPFDANLLLHHNYIPATALYRRELWSDIGGYDTGMTRGYEDWEFWIRAVSRGWRAQRISEILFFYRRHGQTMLFESRKHHRELKAIIRSKHETFYDIRWRFAIAKHYGRQFYQRGSSRLRTSVPLKVRRAVKYLRYRLRPKALIMLPPNRRPSVVTDLIRIRTSAICKVVIFMPWLNVGGVESVVWHTLKQFSKDEISTTIFTTLSGPHSWHSKFESLGISIFHLADMFQDLNDMVGFVLDYCESNDIQVIHITNSEFAYSLIPNIRKQFPDIVIMDTLHMEEPNEPWDFFRLSMSVHNEIDYRIVVATHLKLSLISKYREEANKIRVIENGANIPVPDIVQNTMRNRVVFIGRFVSQKNPLTFLNIAKLVLQSRPEQKFVMIGDGDLCRKISRYRAKYRLEGSVEILPPDQATRVLQESALVLVAPSEREGLPMVGIEAMSQGVPIVASDVEGWRDMLTDGHDGFLVRPNDVVLFASKVVSLIEDQQLYATIRKNAMREYSTRYTAERMASEYKWLYLTAAQRTRHT